MINELKIEILRPFTGDEVRYFVTLMFKRYKVKYEQNIIPHILDLLGSPIPFFLQMLTEELYRHWKKTKKTLAVEDATTVFKKTLLGEMARDKLQHYRSRIDVHYPKSDQEAVRRILNHLSVNGDGATYDKLFEIFRLCEERRTGARKGPELTDAFQHLLLYLQSDFYIEEVEEKRYDFTSKLLKIWWRKYYGYEYGND